MIPKNLVSRLQSSGHINLANDLRNLGAAINRRPELLWMSVAASDERGTFISPFGQSPMQIKIAEKIKQGKKLLGD